jgi:hypothetical protein
MHTLNEGPSSHGAALRRHPVPRGGQRQFLRPRSRVRRLRLSEELRGRRVHLRPGVLRRRRLQRRLPYDGLCRSEGICAYRPDCRPAGATFARSTASVLRPRAARPATTTATAVRTWGPASSTSAAVCGHRDAVRGGRAHAPSNTRTSWRGAPIRRRPISPVCLCVNDNLYVRSVYWAGWALRTKLPVKRGRTDRHSAGAEPSSTNDPTPANAQSSTVRLGHPAIRPCSSLAMSARATGRSRAETPAPRAPRI